MEDSICLRTASSNMSLTLTDLQRTLSGHYVPTKSVSTARSCQRKMMELFGFRIVKSKDLEEERFLQEMALRDSLDEMRKSIEKSMWSLRDLCHNLPFHLNFETKEQADFCHYVLCHCNRVAWPQERRFRFSASKTLRKQMIGKCPIGSGRDLTEQDFTDAEKGDITAALYITKVIFCENRERYKKVNEWFG